jgi:acyl-coenzyme A thioesterase PaaI-like protein
MNAPDPAFAQRCRESFATQQKGFIHGGILGMIADTACGYSAIQDEYPGAGRTLTIARGEVYADDRTHVATMQQTLMMLANTPDTP